MQLADLRRYAQKESRRVSHDSSEIVPPLEPQADGAPETEAAEQPSLGTGPVSA
jgi:hypothetical protein